MTKRYWKLKELEKEKIDEENFWADKKKAKKEGQKYENQRVLDEKMFHQDIEEIPEMREEIQLYKDEDVIAELEAKMASMDLEQKPSESMKAPNGRKLVSVKRNTAQGLEHQQKA